MHVNISIKGMAPVEFETGCKTVNELMDESIDGFIYSADGSQQISIELVRTAIIKKVDEKPGIYYIY